MTYVLDREGGGVTRRSGVRAPLGPESDHLLRARGGDDSFERPLTVPVTGTGDTVTDADPRIVAQLAARLRDGVTVVGTEESDIQPRKRRPAGS